VCSFEWRIHPEDESYVRTGTNEEHGVRPVVADVVADGDDVAGEDLE
jgi:hypothetical protein